MGPAVETSQEPITTVPGREAMDGTGHQNSEQSQGRKKRTESHPQTPTQKVRGKSPALGDLLVMEAGRDA